MKDARKQLLKWQADGAQIAASCIGTCRGVRDLRANLR
jgi:hypothetical protein